MIPGVEPDPEPEHVNAAETPGKRKYFSRLVQRLKEDLKLPTLADLHTAPKHHDLVLPVAPDEAHDKVYDGEELCVIGKDARGFEIQQRIYPPHLDYYAKELTPPTPEKQSFVNALLTVFFLVGFWCLFFITPILGAPMLCISAMVFLYLPDIAKTHYVPAACASIGVGFIFLMLAFVGFPAFAIIVLYIGIQYLLTLNQRGENLKRLNDSIVFTMTYYGFRFYRMESDKSAWKLRCDGQIVSEGKNIAELLTVAVLDELHKRTRKHKTITNFLEDSLQGSLALAFLSGNRSLNPLTISNYLFGDDSLTGRSWCFKGWFYALPVMFIVTILAAYRFFDVPRLIIALLAMCLMICVFMISSTFLLVLVGTVGHWIGFTIPLGMLAISVTRFRRYIKIVAQWCLLSMFIIITGLVFVYVVDKIIKFLNVCAVYAYYLFCNPSLPPFQEAVKDRVEFTASSNVSAVTSSYLRFCKRHSLLIQKTGFLFTIVVGIWAVLFKVLQPERNPFFANVVDAQGNPIIRPSSSWTGANTDGTLKYRFTSDESDGSEGKDEPPIDDGGSSSSDDEDYLRSDNRDNDAPSKLIVPSFKQLVDLPSAITSHSAHTSVIAWLNEHKIAPAKFRSLIRHTHNFSDFSFRDFYAFCYERDRQYFSYLINYAVKCVAINHGKYCHRVLFESLIAVDAASPEFAFFFNECIQQCSNVNSVDSLAEMNFEHHTHDTTQCYAVGYRDVFKQLAGGAPTKIANSVLVKVITYDITGITGHKTFYCPKYVRVQVLLPYLLANNQAYSIMYSNHRYHPRMPLDRIKCEFLTIYIVHPNVATKVDSTKGNIDDQILSYYANANTGVIPDTMVRLRKVRARAVRQLQHNIWVDVSHVPPLVKERNDKTWMLHAPLPSADDPNLINLALQGDRGAECLFIAKILNSEVDLVRYHALLSEGTSLFSDMLYRCFADSRTLKEDHLRVIHAYVNVRNDYKDYVWAYKLGIKLIDGALACHGGFILFPATRHAIHYPLTGTGYEPSNFRVYTSDVPSTVDIQSYLLKNLRPVHLFTDYNRVKHYHVLGDETANKSLAAFYAPMIGTSVPSYLLLQAKFRNTSVGDNYATLDVSSFSLDAINDTWVNKISLLFSYPAKFTADFDVFMRLFPLSTPVARAFADYACCHEAHHDQNVTDNLTVVLDDASLLYTNGMRVKPDLIEDPVLAPPGHVYVTPGEKFNFKLICHSSKLDLVRCYLSNRGYATRALPQKIDGDRVVIGYEPAKADMALHDSDVSYYGVLIKNLHKCKSRVSSLVQTHMSFVSQHPYLFWSITTLLLGGCALLAFFYFRRTPTGYEFTHSYFRKRYTRNEGRGTTTAREDYQKSVGDIVRMFPDQSALDYAEANAKLEYFKKSAGKREDQGTEFSNHGITDLMNSARREKAAAAKQLRKYKNGKEMIEAIHAAQRKEFAVDEDAISRITQLDRTAADKHFGSFGELVFLARQHISPKAINSFNATRRSNPDVEYEDGTKGWSENTYKSFDYMTDFVAGNIIHTVNSTNILLAATLRERVAKPWAEAGLLPMDQIREMSDATLKMKFEPLLSAESDSYDKYVDWFKRSPNYRHLKPLTRAEISSLVGGSYAWTSEVTSVISAPFTDASSIDTLRYVSRSDSHFEPIEDDLPSVPEIQNVDLTSPFDMDTESDDDVVTPEYEFTAEFTDVSDPSAVYTTELRNRWSFALELYFSAENVESVSHVRGIYVACRDAFALVFPAHVAQWVQREGLGEADIQISIIARRGYIFSPEKTFEEKILTIPCRFADIKHLHGDIAYIFLRRPLDNTRICRLDFARPEEGKFDVRYCTRNGANPQTTVLTIDNMDAIPNAILDVCLLNGDSGTWYCRCDGVGNPIALLAMQSASNATNETSLASFCPAEKLVEHGFKLSNANF